MRVAVSGASGLIGRALVSVLRARGDEVLALRRGDAPDPAGTPIFSTNDERAWFDAIDGVDAVVHLAGAPIGERRWNAAVRSSIYASRVVGTRSVVRGLRQLTSPPRVLVCASAIGFYGDRGDEVLTEQSTAGEGFLARVVVDWEAEALRAREVVGRVVLARTGVVLAPDGGVLTRLLPMARLGLAGPFGHGRQFMSPISLVDEVRAIVHAIDTELDGPVNLVGPDPVRNRDFVAVLGRVVSRPAVLPVPAPVLEVVLGSEMARELLLVSQRVEPSVLGASGFAFEHPTVHAALSWAVRDGSLTAAGV
ncbi:domain of unknown function DUF1731 [Acidimicrobium ferrooxidans DSM 10331]|uniref:NAD-dependent epimerase/dehydratase n=1 Tax=Acidimicrobium ferrooxidans (strain DSM 10331 / JCM 15462 / NBRC 103882 / ICP) TaxID=525909 RepID=C7M0Z3_ACIFD|nr:TIGR01777 family oxidoreductase [Acidimicrobium ferrooxidans]ACU54651.1 domain of unknown function DUF1731 [Acidimicrobium ferrooxidans DSM 10331]